MRTNDINLYNGGEASPFDAIKQTHPDGTEFWLARDLRRVTEYSTWEKFKNPLTRAMASARNQGIEPDEVFRRSVKNSGQDGGRPAEDFELTRFAAYLTVMNGDPNMPRIAEAQAYFAIRTREAETRSVAQISNRDLARMVIEEADRADKAETKLAIEQKHRAAIEGGDGIHLTDFGKKYFSEVPARKFDAHLYDKGWLINQKNTRIRPDGEVRDGVDHRKPTAKGRPYIYGHDQGNYGGKRRFQARVRPQMEIELRDALAAEGLPVNTHSTGLVLITNDEMKELGA